MKSVKVPPINLWSWVEAQYLLTRFPLLAATKTHDVVEPSTQIYYNNSTGRHVGAVLRSNEVAK
jgi:hypothetical protein